MTQRSPAGRAVLAAAAEWEPVEDFLAPDVLSLRSEGNRCLLLTFVANIVAYADPATGQSVKDFAPCSPEDPAGVLRLSLEQIPRVTAEVEMKQYQPGERIGEVSQIIRGTARIVNQLAAGRCRLALEIAHRFESQRLQRVLMAGIYGCARQQGDRQVSAQILSELRIDTS